MRRNNRGVVLLKTGIGEVRANYQASNKGRSIKKENLVEQVIYEPDRPQEAIVEIF